MDSRTYDLNGKTGEFSTLGLSPPAPQQNGKKQKKQEPHAAVVSFGAPPLTSSLKDLSFAMFMGSPLDAKYKNMHVASRNRKIIEFFSRPIA